MSQDLDCGCSVGTFTGFPHYVCERHLKIERALGLNPIFPQNYPLSGCGPYDGPSNANRRWLEDYPSATG